LANGTGNDQRDDKKTSTNAHDKTPHRPAKTTLFCEEDWAATRQQSEQTSAIGERWPMPTAPWQFMDNKS
jgi:hypothetical protein